MKSNLEFTIILDRDVRPVVAAAAILTIRMATKQAMVVFQSLYEEALPTRTL